MHTEQLTGRTQQVFFFDLEAEKLLYPGSFDVDFNKRAEVRRGRDGNLDRDQPEDPRA